MREKGGLCLVHKMGVSFPASLLGVFRSIGSGGNNPRKLRTVLQRRFGLKSGGGMFPNHSMLSICYPTHPNLYIPPTLLHTMGREKDAGETPAGHGGDGRSEYEKKHDFVSRNELIKRVPGMLEELDDADFHTVYRLIWSLTSKKALYEISSRGD